MTNNSGKNVMLKKISYIYYPVWFQKSQQLEVQEQVRALLDSDSKINVMNPAFTQKLGFHIQKTNVGAQKIDSSTLKNLEIIIAKFLVKNKVDRLRFF